MSLSDTEEARWNKVQEILDKENAGVKLGIRSLLDYSQPNQASAWRWCGYQRFQHIISLKTGTKRREQIVFVVIPISHQITLLWYKGRQNKYTDVKDIPEMALFQRMRQMRAALLSSWISYLIKLDVKGKELATVANIKENKKNLTISELMLLKHQLLWFQQMLQLSIILSLSAKQALTTRRPSSEEANETQNNGITWLQRNQTGRNQTRLTQLKIIKAYHSMKWKSYRRIIRWYGSASVVLWSAEGHWINEMIKKGGDYSSPFIRY